MSTKPTYKELEDRIGRLLKERDEKFQHLLKNSFDIVILIDSAGIQRYVSDSCEKILGYKPEELTNIPVIEEMIHPDDKEDVIKGFESIIQKKNYGGAQYRHRHKNGGWIYLEAYGTNQLDNPHINSIVLNVRDITERKKTEQKLKESELHLSELNATKDRFFSIIAHDLRTPFSNIVGLSEILTEQIQIEERNFEELELLTAQIHESSKRAMGLINDLLEWARVQTGQIRFNPEKLSLYKIISNNVDLFKDFARQKSVTVDADITADKMVYADKKMLSTILRNLISNSIKFNFPGGKTKISTKEKEGEIIISVEDNGIGIDNKTLEKLFQPGETPSAKGTQNEKGTGLGLLLCKDFVDMHEGKIWVESQPDKGSKFSFTLPVGE